jgi:O-acetyl-ADP-ribose deacetylase (regulator of RNase III)
MIDDTASKVYCLCAPNDAMAQAWEEFFGQDPRFCILPLTVPECSAEAWSTSSDSLLLMGGGLDRALAQRLPDLPARAAFIRNHLYRGFMPVGTAAVIPTGEFQPAWAVLVPTMPNPMALPSSAPIYAAMLALVKTVMAHPAIRRIAVPAYGTGIGNISCYEAARAMRQAVITYDEKYQQI